MKLIGKKPLVGVVCGSGFGTLCDSLENRIDLRWSVDMRAHG